MERLLPLVEESKKLDLELEEVKEKKCDEMLKTLKILRTRLTDHSDITDEMQKRLDETSIDVEKKIVDTREKKNALAEKARVILNFNQLTLLRDYEPCMVPTKNVSNPDRIGGVIEGEKFAEILANLRKLPPEKFFEEKKKILQKKTLSMKVYNNEAQIKSVISQMQRAMDRARKLDDREFAIRKDELSVITMPPSPRPGMEEEFLHRFLLNPFLIDVLKKRITESKH
jgi:hypothetical protein